MINGLVIVNKESQMSSQAVVSKVKKILNVKKAGHTGTLDPLAEGVLPILIGEATKLSKYLIEHDKTYIAILKLGILTETGDEEGNIIEEKSVPQITENDVRIALQKFCGKQKQAPHRYSAVKINGKKLYEYSRSGENVEIPERDIEIYDIELLNFENDEIEFKVDCSKGTYIRVLCEDIAKSLGTIGYMKHLTRTRVSDFDIIESVKLDDLTDSNIILPEKLCGKYNKIELNDRKLELFLNGVKITYNENDGVYSIYNDKKFIGLGIIEDNLLKRDIIFNY